MDRCNDLCTKDATGACALCEALAERNRFLRFWFQGGLFVDGVHAMEKRGVFALLHRYALPLTLLFLVGLMLWLAWLIPRSIAWRSTLSRFMHENPIFVIALLISLLIPLFWLLLWKLPQWQVAAVPEIKDRIDLESKSRQTLAQILGGAALLVGLYFTSQTLRTTQEGQITDRFTKAIAQLGDKNVAVRLGGIYALERIAKDSEDDHWAVMEILTAFVREQTRERKTVTVLKESPEIVEISLQKMGEFPSDIQAALTALGRRTRTHNNGERQLLKLYYANLEGAYLWQANLQGAILKGTNLQSANLIQANLQEASLEGVNLQGAILLRANLQDARLTQANLQYAFLGSDDPRGEIVSATLQRGYLWQANLQGASLGGG